MHLLLFDFIYFIIVPHFFSFFSLFTIIPIFHSVSFRFGAITMMAGIIGVPLGTYLSQLLSKKTRRWDPIICASGLLISAPLLTGAMIMIRKNELIAYTLVFFGEVALNLNWAIVADILLVRIESIYTSFFFFSIFCLSFLLSFRFRQNKYEKKKKSLFLVSFFRKQCDIRSHLNSSTNPIFI